jgi:hypothetical protein
MNENILLISYKTVTENSNIGENFNPQVIRTQIKEVQEMYVADLLGVNLYEKVKADISADTLTGIYKDLVNEYLKPVFIYGILETLPFAGNYHFANSGVIERTAANSNNVDPKELQKLSDYYKTRRAFYSDKVSEYIKSHNDEFAELFSGQERKDKPKKPQYDVGIYLG